MRIAAFHEGKEEMRKELKHTVKQTVSDRIDIKGAHRDC
jgi:hypothetical protein